MISASLLMKEGELRIEHSWRISVHRCWNSVNLLLEVILLKSILPVYSYQQALSRTLTHSPPPWLSRNNPVSLGIYSAFSHFCNNQRQRETDLSICGAQRDWPKYLSSVSNRAVSSCLTDGSETIPPGMVFKLGPGWSVKALCIYWIAIKVLALVDGQVWSPVLWQLGWDR